MSNHNEQMRIAISEGTAIPFLVDARRGTVRNTNFDLIGYTSGAAQRDEVPYPADGTSTVFQIASSDANDTILGTGARSVNIFYLDENGDFQFTIVELDGQTPVDLPAAFRILGASVQTGDTISVPEDDKTTGDVSIGSTFTLGVPSTVYMQISKLTGQCNSGVVTIPRNHRGVFKAAFASGPKNDQIEFLLFNRATGRQWTSPAGFFSSDDNAVNNFVVDAFDSLEDIELRAKSETGNAELHVLFNVVFVPVPAAS